MKTELVHHRSWPTQHELEVFPYVEGFYNRRRRHSTLNYLSPIDSSERLGRRRWVIEPIIARPAGYRRLSPRRERHPRNHLTFPGLAVALVCYKRLSKLTR